MVISKLRKELYDSIKKYGINSEEAYRLSVKLDYEIDRYIYNGMKQYYEKSIDALERYKKKNGYKPTKWEWNQLAKEKKYLCAETMKYIGDIKFE